MRCVLILLISLLVSMPATGSPLRNILLVTVDTLRADHLGAYGYEGKISPHLDALARRGVLFEDALTTIGKTGPAFASLFSSLHPPTHGARRNGVPMRDDVPLLTEILAAHGYTTAAFISNWTLKHHLSGVGRGFHHYDETFTRQRNPLGAAERDAVSVTVDALNWLKENRATDDNPLFVWVHYSEPHTPYREHDDYLLPKPDEEERSGGWRKRWRYASEVRFTDHWIGTLLEESRAYLPTDSTLVLFLADHGESLGEHGYWGHGKNVHWPNLEIPFMMVGPGIPAGRRLRSPVSIVDVMPTLLGLLELQPPKGIDGLDLSESWRAPLSPERPRYAFGERMTAFTKKAKVVYEHPLEIALQTGNVKTIFNFSQREVRYYDLKRDPREENPLEAPPVKMRPPIGRRLSEWYRNLGKYEARSDGELSSEDMEQLKALGYIGP